MKYKIKDDDGITKNHCKIENLYQMQQGYTYLK